MEIQGLRAFYDEINKRDYQGILGLKAEVSEKDYFEMLEILPPKNFTGSSWCMSEYLTGPLTTKFYKKDGKFYAEVVDYRLEKKDGENYGYEDEWDNKEMR